MTDWKAICKKLLFPPLWLILLLTVLSAAGLTVIFVRGWETALFAYGAYVAAFYTLTVLCLACWKTLPGYYRSIKGSLYHNRYTNRYLTDTAFKTHVSLYVSLGINLLYAGMNMVSAAFYHTWWFVLFAVYYTVLAVMRFLLVRYVHRNSIGTSRLGELKRSRLCACILILINLILSGAVLMMIYFDRGFEYRGILIYVMALYTFYTTGSAIRDMIKYRKLGSPVMSTSKIIKFAAALVSMLSLETAMFSQFGGDMAPEDQQLMIILTGAGIAIILVAMSAYIILHNTKEIRKIKGELHHGQPKP